MHKVGESSSGLEINPCSKVPDDFGAASARKFLTRQASSCMDQQDEQKGGLERGGRWSETLGRSNDQTVPEARPRRHRGVSLTPGPVNDPCL